MWCVPAQRVRWLACALPRPIYPGTTKLFRCEFADGGEMLELESLWGSCLLVKRLQLNAANFSSNCRLSPGGHGGNWYLLGSRGVLHGHPQRDSRAVCCLPGGSSRHFEMAAEFRSPVNHIAQSVVAAF